MLVTYPLSYNGSPANDCWLYPRVRPNDRFFENCATRKASSWQQIITAITITLSGLHGIPKNEKQKHNEFPILRNSNPQSVTSRLRPKTKLYFYIYSNLHSFSTRQSPLDLWLSLTLCGLIHHKPFRDITPSRPLCWGDQAKPQDTAGTLCPTLSDQCVGVFKSHRVYQMNMCCETGRTDYRPKTRWLESLTFCRCKTKGTYQKSEQASRTGHFENEISFFREFSIKTHHCYAYYMYVQVNWSGWTVPINDGTLFTNELVWPASFD